MSNTDTTPRPDLESSLSDVVRRNIRGAIARAGKTQGSFATDTLRKNVSWLSRRLRKENPAVITFDELDTIARALGTSPDELIRR